MPELTDEALYWLPEGDHCDGLGHDLWCEVVLQGGVVVGGVAEARLAELRGEVCEEALVLRCSHAVAVVWEELHGLTTPGPLALPGQVVHEVVAQRGSTRFGHVQHVQAAPAVGASAGELVVVCNDVCWSENRGLDCFRCSCSATCRCKFVEG
jgi:hypothetical protein